MKVKRLLEILKDLDPELPIFYRDGNFGGRSEEFSESDLSLEHTELLIRSPYWEDCEASS